MKDTNSTDSLLFFSQVFENSAGHEMMDKFGDVLQFANHVARLFVTEVRRRASDQSTGMFHSKLMMSNPALTPP